MNLTIFRALFEDARQQVLDNKVFRLLLILTAVPILFTFLVGFHEEHMSLFWGWKEITYKEFLDGFGGAGQSNSEDLAATFIRALQDLTVLVFVGNFGIMLCVAATAFFAPKILEKGSADTLFSKPVSRMAILLSRYFAGILFVAFISMLLVTGMYLGFLVNSGFNDPGFLWGALTLTYIYAMLHAFSIVVAVFTRSSTAAILLTISLFMVGGAVHSGWIFLEFTTEQQHVAMLRSDDGEESGEEEPGTIVETLMTTLRVFHYVLPKTSDADIITTKLKRALTEKDPVIKTADGEFLLKLPPADFELVESTADKFEATGMEWTAGDNDDLGADHVRVRRYKRPEIERKIGSKIRKRSQTSKEAADIKEEELKAAGLTAESENRKIGGVRAIRLSWSEAEGDVAHRVHFFHFDDWMYVIEVSGTAAQLASREARQLRHNFMERGNIILGNIAGKTPESWYMDVFTWRAEWKYNILFSIGSSVAFIVSMLTLAWLRLRKLDF